MKTQLKVIALSVLVTTWAYAKESKDMYFGLGVVQSKFDHSSDGLTTKYKKNNWKALIGTRLNSNWSIEGQYTDFATDSIAANFDISGDSFGVAGLYHFNPQANHSPFVKLGWHSWNAKETLTDLNVSGSEDGHDEFYGVGIDGKINETMKYRVEFERMRMGRDVDIHMDNIGVGLLFNF